MKILSKELSNELGKGFSRSNLQNMRNLYLCYPNCQTLSGELSWSHYCELLSISDESKRNFYEKEIINSNWSVRELKRQIDTSLFERLYIRNGKGGCEGTRIDDETISRLNIKESVIVKEEVKNGTKYYNYTSKDKQHRFSINITTTEKENGSILQSVHRSIGAVIKL